MQYPQMNALRDKLNGHFDGSLFEILGVPNNQFGLQEPGHNDEILNGLKYVRPGGGYVPNFLMTTKSDVNGPDEHPLYTFLKVSYT